MTIRLRYKKLPKKQQRNYNARNGRLVFEEVPNFKFKYYSKTDAPYSVYGLRPESNIVEVHNANNENAAMTIKDHLKNNGFRAINVYKGVKPIHTEPFTLR